MSYTGLWFGYSRVVTRFATLVKGLVGMAYGPPACNIGGIGPSVLLYYITYVTLAPLL